jgi:tetratricopeptide (TPR) repeat protein
MLLERDQLDDAISLFERAVSLNPMNGENYYYLSEAWLAKGDRTQAKEFNHLAGRYLKEAVWAAKLAEQQERIRRGHR